MDFEELSQAATLSRNAFYERFPNALLISAAGDDDDSGANFDTPSGGTPIGSKRPKHESAPLEDRTPGDSTRPQRRPSISDPEIFAQAGRLLNQGPDSEVEDAAPEASSVTLAIKLKSDSLLCLPLIKSSRNPFGQMITVGRTPNNDIILKELGVSKFHAYLTKRGEVWWVHDQGSTNGTFVAKKRIDAKGAQLENGTRLAFGQKMKFRFYTPAGIYSVLTGK